jgi:hypothetical protein
MLNWSNLWYPRSTAAAGNRLIATRALRGLGDGAVSVLLPSYLTAIGFSSLRVGAIRSHHETKTHEHKRNHGVTNVIGRAIGSVLLCSEREFVRDDVSIFIAA